MSTTHLNCEGYLLWYEFNLFLFWKSVSVLYFLFLPEGMCSANFWAPMAVFLLVTCFTCISSVVQTNNHSQSQSMGYIIKSASRGNKYTFKVQVQVFEVFFLGCDRSTIVTSIWEICSSNQWFWEKMEGVADSFWFLWWLNSLLTILTLKSTTNTVVSWNLVGF